MLNSTLNFDLGGKWLQKNDNSKGEMTTQPVFFVLLCLRDLIKESLY